MRELRRRGQTLYDQELRAATDEVKDRGSIVRVAVLGAGLQGACVAMELASAGITVDLYDKSDRCVTQASAQNEGKIHLGCAYANDRTLNTARTMVRGTITFSSLMRRWIGSDIDTIPVSPPFYYVVHT